MNSSQEIKFSVVVPLYNCSETVEELCQRLVKVFSNLDCKYEIIFVNDSSPSNDWELITELSKKNNQVKGINLSRNFGQHYAITAGLEHVSGEWIIVMDGDLQDQPEEIVKLYKTANLGYDIVLAKRHLRKDTFFKKLSSGIFYRLFGYLTDTKYDSSVANFGIYHSKVIESVIKMKDKSRVFPILVQWVGFKKTSVYVNHNKREFGKSSYNFKSLINLAIDIIISFSNKPLKLAVKLGFSITLISFFVTLFYLYRYFNNEILVEGYTSLILSIWLLSGIIIFSIGILGLYIGRIFDGIKDRPYYIIKEKYNFDE